MCTFNGIHHFILQPIDIERQNQVNLYRQIPSRTVIFFMLARMGSDVLLLLSNIIPFYPDHPFHRFILPFSDLGNIINGLQIQARKLSCQRFV